jgi:hypothetical protein
MPNRQIKFVFEGKTYWVDTAACEKCSMILPDGWQLRADFWVKKNPVGLHRVPHGYGNFVAEDVAKILDVPLAVEA